MSLNKSFIPLLFSLMAILFFSSCAPKPGLSPDLSRRARDNPDYFVDEARARASEVRSLGGRFEFIINLNGRKSRAEGILLAMRDGFLRIEVGGPFGGSSLLFLMNETRVFLYYIKDKKVVLAPSTEDSLFRLVGVRLSPAEAVAVLLSSLVPVEGYRFSPARFDEENGFIEVSISSYEGEGTILIDPKIPAYSSLRLKKGGKEVYISYRSFSDVGFRLFPRIIEITFPAEGLTLLLKAKDVTVNPASLKDDDFFFSFPNRVSFIPLSSIKGETPLLFREGE
jgi:hypothetical protein